MEAEFREIAKPAEGKSLEDRFRAVMKRCHNHWMVTNENEQFTGSVAAMLINATDDEKRHIEMSLKIIKALSAAISGVPVDFENVLAEVEASGLEQLPLQKWWQETAA
jgi:spore germination protein YaaH